MSDSSSVETLGERERAESSASADYLSRDLANPAMYVSAAFPRPKENAVTLAPQIPETDPVANNNGLADTDTAIDGGEPVRSEFIELSDGGSSRRGRASQALAEMKNAAQQRGLLKTSGDDDSGSTLPPAQVDETPKVPTETAIGRSFSRIVSRDRVAAKEGGSEHSAADDETVADESSEDSSRSNPRQIDDASRRERLVVLADWLADSIGMSDVFLIDSCGYSLLPEKTATSDSAADTLPEQSGTAVALHDLGLRLGTVLDLAGRRLARDSSDKEAELGSAGRVARLTLDNDRCLAVAKVAMTQGAERPLLGWVEALRKPLADSWVESACDYTADVLARDFMS